MAEYIERAFPELTRDGYSETSPADLLYNCVAWAAGDTTRWWWPIDESAYWPEGCPRDWSLEGFASAFRALGYEPCDDDRLEARFEKVAIYVRADGRPTHVARQLASGQWTSKLGEMEDIAHTTVHGVEGGLYGRCARILHRQTDS